MKITNNREGFSKDEIIRALKLIQEICSCGDCDDCPLSKKNPYEEYRECALADCPNEWALNDPEDKIWRAIL